MPLKTGTLALADLLENDTTLSQLPPVDISRINEVLENELEVSNGIFRDMLTDLAEPVSDALIAEGTGASGSMIRMDEYSRAPTQKVAGAQNLGFPIDGYQYALGWTRRFRERNSVAVIARQVQAAQRAHRAQGLLEIKRAIFPPTNYTHYDHLATPQLAVAVKRLLNADSWNITEGPNGEVFDGATHTHYLGSATLTAGAVQSAIDTVAEHGWTSQLRVVINIANETAFKALTGFEPYVDTRIIPAPGDATTALDRTRTNNRPIGFFGLAEVWVKPWAIANYLMVYDVAGRKPLGYRERGPGGLGGLRIVAENEAFPFTAQYMEAEFGFGVRTRSNGAILYFANATYAAPTIADAA